MPYRFAELISPDEVQLLSTAPIREAILQIRFDAIEDVDLEKLSAIRESLPKDFSDFTKNRTAQLSFNLTVGDDKAESQAVHSLAGYSARTADGKFNAIFRSEDFTFSMLQPYSSWQDFRERALNIWKIYKSHLPPIEFSRVALRYINELSIPIENEEFDFETYLVMPPKLPEKLGETIDSYFSRIVIPFPEHHTKVVAINSFDSIVDNCVKIILDNDAFRTEVSEFSDSDVWEFFDSLRLIKDTVFFRSLTNKAIELFK